MLGKNLAVTAFITSARSRFQPIHLSSLSPSFSTMLSSFRVVLASTSRIPAAIRAYHTSSPLPQAADVSRPKPIAENPFTSSDFPAPPPSFNPAESRNGGSAEEDPHAWWKDESRKRNGDSRIISKFHGRSLEIKRPGEFAQQYRALKRLINQTGLRKEVRLQEYYEKPSERRVRVASENHRKRFAAVVSNLVLLLRCRLTTSGERKGQACRALQEETMMMHVCPPTTRFDARGLGPAPFHKLVKCDGAVLMHD